MKTESRIFCSTFKNDWKRRKFLPEKNFILKVLLWTRRMYSWQKRRQRLGAWLNIFCSVIKECWEILAECWKRFKKTYAPPKVFSHKMFLRWRKMQFRQWCKNKKPESPNCFSQGPRNIFEMLFHQDFSYSSIWSSENVDCNFTNSADKNKNKKPVVFPFMFEND